MLDLWRETWTSTYGPGPGADALRLMLSELDLGLAAMFGNRGERGYALVGGRQIVGSAIAAERGEVAYLWGIYVLPAHQRSGAGSQSIAAVARELHVSTSLEVRVPITSRRAQAFYRARGFRVIGKETTEIMRGVDAPTTVLRVEVARLRATPG